MSIFNPMFWYAIAAIFCFGNISGGLLVYKIWNVSYTHSKIETLKRDNQLFRKAAGLSNEIDDESEQVRQENEKLVRDILAGLKRPEPTVQKEEHYVYINVPLPMPVAGKVLPPKKQKRVTGRPVCITSDSMLSIGRLQ